jgi:hypothetical protein
MTIEEQGKIIKNVLWYGSAAVGFIAARTTYELGKKIIEKIYINKYCK